MDFNDYVPGWVYKQTYETYIYSDPYVNEAQELVNDIKYHLFDEKIEELP